MLNRREILSRAIHDCYAEMYAKAQPPLDYDATIKGIKSGEIIDTNENPLYRRHYLSQAEFLYIRKKYMDAYNIKESWNPNIDFLLESLTEGGYKDVYVKEENGTSHREAERTKTIYEIVGRELGEEVIQTIKDLKNFYRFDREEGDFSCSIALGGSPTSNKKSVEEYWAAQGKPITIEERDPDTFWYRDEYGDKWKEVLEEEENEDA